MKLPLALTRPSLIVGITLLPTLVTAFAGIGCRSETDPTESAILARSGYAQLENEEPAAAAETFAELVELLPADPLPHGNLALSLLRSERPEEALAAIQVGLKRFPEHPKLLAILATVQQWLGESDAALAASAQAANLAPESPEIQFSLYRIADQLSAEPQRSQALDRLVQLRPENLVVLLSLGKTALAQADGSGDARAQATRAYLRTRELAWDNPDATTVLERLLQALSDNDLDAARTPSIQLENLLKITPAYRQSLRELDTGIQGIPIRNLDLATDPLPAAPPLALSFDTQPLLSDPQSGVAASFFSGDTPDWVALSPTGDLATIQNEATRAGESGSGATLSLVDVNNDGFADAIVSGSTGVQISLGDGKGQFDEWSAFGIEVEQGSEVAAIDFDIEGDLDLAVATASGVRLFQNTLTGPLAEITEHSKGLDDGVPVGRLLSVDLDSDGDLDLVGSQPGRVVWWSNLRQGEFRLEIIAPLEATALAVGDLDNDHQFELVVAGPDTIEIFSHSDQGFFSSATMPASGIRDLAIGDLDADGRFDLVAAGANGVQLWQNTDSDFLAPMSIFSDPASALLLVDDDRDCDLDILVAGKTGLNRLETQTETQYHCLRVRLRGLTEGSSKNNVLGLGTLVEVSVGDRTLTAEAAAEETFFGLGEGSTADLLRVVWTNGVPQNRFQLAADATVVEEQLLKGSCPFLYAWDGSQFSFVTDLLWGSPMGLPVAPGMWAEADPSELVHIPGAVPVDGTLDLRITEELWEAAFFDHLRLWVVEVEDDLEVTTSLKILPGQSTPELVHATRQVRPVVAATDAQGRDVTAQLRSRDQVYADGWTKSPYQGVPAEPWTMEFDLGELGVEATSAPSIRLLLDGWIFPSDASLNLAVGQRTDLSVHGPRLEILHQGQWQLLVDQVGFPAGKTKTMVVDLPPLPAGAHRLRLVAAQWLSFDRIAWSSQTADDEVKVVRRATPNSAQLRSRGFSRLVRQAPNAPHTYDYQVVESRAPWIPFPGRYTSYGEVSELLEHADDQSVILAAGDEMRVLFDLTDLPEPAHGYRYQYFLESHGWDKDADRNTYQAAQVEPLPFRAMSGYPFAPGEEFPDTAEMRDYRKRWLTRELAR